MPERGEARRILEEVLRRAIAAADPREILAAHLPPLPKGRVVVVGFGKSAAVMAAAVEAAWFGVPLNGVVVTRYGHAVPTRHIKVIEAAHPVPDENSVRAAREILAAVQGLGPDDLVLALVSGGGSALLTLPAPGLTLEDKRAVNAALLASGATIHEMNVVRKHLSAIKGGRLAAAAAPARVVTLAISDVPGDDPAIIASGPTVPDPSSFADARAIIARYRLDIPERVRRHLERGEGETPKPGSLPHASFTLIATPMMALRAAREVARSHGLGALILGDALEGESRALALAHAGIARSVRRHGEPASPPLLLLSGGETTVTLSGGGKPGRGGRNTEFLLALALALEGEKGVYALAADTDGIDGTEDAAGALIGPDTLSRARARGLEPRTFLERHDSYSFFSALGDLIITGPTLTNVNDIRALLITEA